MIKPPKRVLWVGWAGLLLLSGCVSSPLSDYTTEAPAMVLLPVNQAGLRDGRARFREIYCAINAERGQSLPDYRPCDEALVRLPDEVATPTRPVNLGSAGKPLKILAVPGIGWKCFRDWLDAPLSGALHVRQFAYSADWLAVDALSGTERNAKLIRDAIMARPPESDDGGLVLLGYSKGAADILEALVSYPEIVERLTAVVSVAGAIGGSPLANRASQKTANLLTNFPRADCEVGDEKAVESLTTSVRRNWLATHTLPDSIPYYSLATYPEPKRISSALKSSYKKLAQVDPRNDSQLIFYDQLIPGSTLMGYVNGDHWSIAVPIDRSHEFVASTLVDQNDFPREVLLEAILRFVEDDLAQ
ncbi:MAG: hypothetical protein P8Y61_09490 [Gammaproteobacteria bacterium]